jgi:predicted protein tyrosine phosphatase
MLITVTNRYFFEGLRGTPKEEELFQTHRIISINSMRPKEDPPFSLEYWDLPNVLVLRFDDVTEPDLEKGYTFFDSFHADAIASFVETSDTRPIIAHCKAGISRSGAVCLALNEYFNNRVGAINEEDHLAFSRINPQVSANYHVLKLLWKRLKL